MFDYDVSKSNMWREVHDQPQIIAHVMEENEAKIQEICRR